MSYILIPHIVTTTTAMIWVGAIDEKVRLTPVFLQYNIMNDKIVHTVKLSPSEWRTWKTRHPLETPSKSQDIKAIHYQRVTIGLEKNKELIPRTKYVVKLVLGKEDEMRSEEPASVAHGTFQDYSKTIGQAVSESVQDEEHLTKATVTTLPDKLPESSEVPFKVLLGSCFYLPNDPDGLVGKSFLNIPDEEKPEIKFLCGDQVYLDNPWKETTSNFPLAFSPRENMRKLFFEKYLKTWTQVTRGSIEDKDGNIKRDVITGGFNALLRNDANYFCPDDHEYWNNAPNFGFVGAALTLLPDQRHWWFREARELFRFFQSLAPWMTFDVPPLSFCIVDMRTNRGMHYWRFWKNNDVNFMEADDLEAVGNWIENLEGPGVLVTGQVLLTKKSSYWSALFDHSLPDYEKQYARLVKYINNSKHSIVLVTGDVHFGRVAVCDLDAGLGTKFVEVVSSPMMVVSNWRNKAKVGKFEYAPETFLTEVENYQVADLQNHFATLEFKKNDRGNVDLTVKAWKILHPNTENTPESDLICTIELK